MSVVERDGRDVAGVSGDVPGVDGVSAVDAGSEVERRRAVASSLATELCDLPPSVWQRRAVGATSSHVAFIEDEPELADAVADAWDLARSQPSQQQVQARTGVAGMVVVAHGTSWSLVARAGGPILILTDRINGVLRVDRDPFLQVELATLVSELVNVAQGLPPFDESQVAPWSQLPWHRDR